MSIKDEDIIVVDPPPLSAAESFFLPEVFKGLGTTLKHMVGSVGRGKRNRALCYPEQHREDLPLEEGGLFKDRYRGVHRLNRDEEGRVKCVACFMCQSACPANCITVDEAGSHQATFPHILARQSPCVVCTDLSCMKVCPTDALSLLEVDQINMGYAVLNDMTCLRGPGGDQEDCRLCIESCPRGEEAISVDQYHGIIEIRDGCIGCGVCEHACPTDPASIWVEPRMDF